LARFGLLFAFLGLLLFAYFVRKAGVTQIIEGIKRLGFGFLLVLAISALRQVVRSLAWTKCFEAPYFIRFRDAFAARIMGDALGNIIPLASVAIAEPSKAAFVSDSRSLDCRPLGHCAGKYFLQLIGGAVYFLRHAALLLSFSLPKPLRYASFGALIAVVVIVPLGYLVIRRQWKFLSGPMGLLQRRGIARGWMEKTISARANA